MPTYEITAPDGRVLEVTAPDGATQEQVLAYAQQNYRGAEQEPPRADFGNVRGGSRTTEEPPAPYYVPGFGTPGVAKQVGGFVDAAQHHVMNIPHGIAQFAENNLAMQSRVLPDGNPITDFLTRNAAQTNNAMREREAAYQQRTEGNAGSYIGAGAGEVVPWMLGIGALRAAGALPKVAQTGAKGLAIKGGLLAAEGALMGGVQPVVGEGPYFREKAGQVAEMALAAPALAGTGLAVKKAIGGVRQAARYATPGGREVVANQRVAGLLGDDPATIAALRTPVGVPGFSLSPAQALANPKAVQAERVLRNNGLSAPEFAAVDSANNAALRDQVAKLAGTDADVAAAKAARKAATDPYYAQLPGQRADPAPVLAALDGLSNSSMGVRKGIKEAVASLRSEIQSRIGPDGKIGADILSGLHENAGSHLGPMATAQEKAALGPLRDQIADALDAAVPGYRDNLAAYARASQPLTDMAAGRALLDAIDSGSRDAGGGQAVTLGQLKSLLAKDAKAKYKMSTQARQQLEAVRDALQRRSISSNTIAATGPGTAADTMRGGLSSPLAQRVMGHLGGVLGGAAGSMGGPFGGAAGYGAGLLAVEGINAANNAVTRRVGQKAASAPLAADAIEAYLQSQQRSQSGLFGGMPRYLLPYLD